MRNLTLVISAWSLIVVGAIVFPMPIPLGAIMIVIGFAMLITINPAAARLFKRIRSRLPILNRLIHRTKHRLPRNLQQALHETDPEL